MSFIDARMVFDSDGQNISEKVGVNASSLADIMPLSGDNTSSLQTTYDGNGNLTQTKELDTNTNLLIQTDITYNSDGTVNTITETYNGKQHKTTLNYVNGSLSTTNPFTRSVI